MPSNLHEMLIEMFRFRPSLAADLLADVLGLDVPAHQQVGLAPADCTDLVPTEYRADAVVTLTGADGPVLAVVVEVQLNRDQAKRWSWPVYVATLRARLQCPTELLVVCASRAVAAWCATPVRLGLSGSRVIPLVVGPDLIPVVTDVDEASRAPELVVLSAVAHGGEPANTDVLGVLLQALSFVENQQAFLYLELVLAALPVAARRHLEELMSTQTHEYLSEYARKFVAQGKAEGKAEGEARAVLAFLDARGVAVPDDVRSRIDECRDLDRLDTWVRRAATVSSVDDLFD